MKTNSLLRNLITKSVRPILTALYWMGFLAAVPAIDHYVATNGGNNSPYTSWADAASNNIQLAVSAAINGETVWISNGVYLLTNQISVASNITIRGNPGELVVVDGQYSNRCFYFGPAVQGTLSNLFITRGSNDQGGGVLFAYGSVLDCVFSNNISTNGTANTVGGGGLYIGAGTANIMRCTFVANQARGGGGLAWYSASAQGGIISQCTFSNNITTNFVAPSAQCNGGAAAWLYLNANVVVTGCNFIGNYSYRGMGAGLRLMGINFQQPLLFTHCTFSNNVITIGELGGGIYNQNHTNLTITNCNFINNDGMNAGGGFSLTYGLVKNCYIARNRAASGGGISIGAAFVQDSIIEENWGSYGGAGGVAVAGNGTLRNCLVRNNYNTNSVNYNTFGGGLVISGTNVSILSCTIVSNYATKGAGGLYNQATNGSIVNCIIYSNTCATVSPSNNIGNAYAVTTNFFYSNCCFYPMFSGEETNYAVNCITNNPLFADPASGNWRLNKDSPCINAGVNQDWMIQSRDLDGEHHRIDGLGRVVDIGAYEFLPSGNLIRIQ